MYKTVEEVQAALATRLPETELKEVNGFNYVPWEVTARQLDTIFGPFGWSEEITRQHYDTERNIYIVSRVIEGRATVSDSAGDEPFTYTATVRREAVGVGQPADQTPRGIDAAIKGADSDSFSRAAKKLGDAFGLYLYDRDDPARKASSSSRPSSGNATGGANTYQPSAGQLKFLHSLGYNDGDIAGMDFKTWKAILDNKTQKPAGFAEQARAEAGMPF